MPVLKPEDLAAAFGIKSTPAKIVPTKGAADISEQPSTNVVPMSEREAESFASRGITVNPDDPSRAYQMRYDRQSTLDRAGNAFTRGTIGALGVMLENASYMTLQPIGEMTGMLDDWEQNAVAQWGEKLKQEAHERFPNYQADPSKVDWSPWAILGDLIENGLGFAIPGVGAAKGVSMATKALRAGRVGAYASHLRKTMGLVGSTEKALNFMAPGFISNMAEGTMMGFETYKDLIAQGYSEEEASSAADEVLKNNRYLMLSDMIQLHGIYKGTKAMRNTMNNPSEWKQNIKSAFTTMNADNPVFQSLVEGGEEVFQGIIQREAESKVTTEGKQLRKDKGMLGRIGEYFKDESLWYEGALGFLSGGAQQMIMKEVGNAIDRNKYGKIGAEIQAVQAELAQTTDVQRKVVLESRIQDLTEEATRTTQQGMYEAQQTLIKETDEHLKHRFKQEIRLDVMMKEALASGDLSTVNALQSAKFRTVAYDNMARGTLDTLERQLKDMLAENLSEEEIKDRGYDKNYKAKIQSDLNLLDTLESDYITASGYINPSEVYHQTQKVRVVEEGLSGIMSTISDVINGTKDENNKVISQGLQAAAEAIANEVGASEFNFNKFIAGGLKLGDVEDVAEKNKLRTALEKIEASKEYKEYKELNVLRKKYTDEVEASEKHLNKLKSIEYQQKVDEIFREAAKRREAQKKANIQKKEIIEKQQKAAPKASEQQGEEVGKDVNTPPTAGTAAPIGPETPRPASQSPTPPEIKVESASSQNPPVPKTNTLEDAKKEIEEKIKDKKKEALKNLKKVTLSRLDGKSVKYKGSIYKVDLSDGKITLVGDKIDYELDSSFLNEDISSLGIKEIKDSKKPHTINSISESQVSVNGVEYVINLDSKGNIISLSPNSNLKQKIKNEAILVAVEIARNKLDNNTIKDAENLDEVYADTLENNAELRRVDLILGENYTESIEEVLGKLYAEEKLTPEEQLILSIWLQDAIIVMTKERVKYPKSDIFQNALDNLYLIDLILYGGKNDKQQKPKSSGSSESSKETIRSSKEETQKEGEQVTKITKGPESKKEEIVDLKKEIYKQEQRELKILEDLLNAKSVQDLLTLYNSLTPEEKALFKEFFIERRNELAPQSENKPEQAPKTPPAVTPTPKVSPEEKTDEEITSDVLGNVVPEGDQTINSETVKDLKDLINEGERDESTERNTVLTSDSYKITTNQREYAKDESGNFVEVSDDYKRDNGGNYPEDTVTSLDLDVKEGTKLVFEISEDTPIKGTITYAQHAEAHGVDINLIPIRILTEDGRFLGWVPSAKGNNSVSQLRSEIYSRLIDGEPLSGEITHRYDKTLFKLTEGKVMSGEEAFPDTDVLAVVRLNGKVEFSDGNTVPIPDKFKNPGFTHIILPNGNFVACYPNQIDEGHANMMVDAIEVFIRSIHPNNKGKKANEFIPTELMDSYNALKAAGYNPNSQKSLENFLSMYLFTVTPDKRYNTITEEERAMGITSPLAKYVMFAANGDNNLGNKPMVQIQSNGVAFLMDNQKTAHGVIGYSIGANTPYQVIEDAEWKDQLKQVILASYRNTSKEHFNKDVVDLQRDIQEDGTNKITSKKTPYNKLAKSGVSTPFKSTNMGTEEKPNWVYSVNPIIRFTVNKEKVEATPKVNQVIEAKAEPKAEAKPKEELVSSTVAPEILAKVLDGSLDPFAAMTELENLSLDNTPEYRRIAQIFEESNVNEEADAIILSYLEEGDLIDVLNAKGNLKARLNKKGILGPKLKILDYAAFLNEVNKFSDELDAFVKEALSLPASFKLARLASEQNGFMMFNESAFGFYDFAKNGFTKTNVNLMGKAMSDIVEDYLNTDSVMEFLHFSKIHKINCK